MKELVFYSAFFTLVSVSLGSFYDRELNSECSSELKGSNGVCVEAKDCPEFKTLKNKLKICSFQHRVPIVCCPRLSSIRDGQKRMSAISKR